MSDAVDILNAMHAAQTRRRFLHSAGYGVGLAALSQMMGKAEGANTAPVDPQSGTPAHLLGKAKQCIFIFLEGAPSQLDMFDPKPKLNELNGQPLPESLT
jgi:hypothetical protein